MNKWERERSQISWHFVFCLSLSQDVNRLVRLKLICSKLICSTAKPWIYNLLPQPPAWLGLQRAPDIASFLFFSNHYFFLLFVSRISFEPHLFREHPVARFFQVEWGTILGATYLLRAPPASSGHLMCDCHRQALCRCPKVASPVTCNKSLLSVFSVFWSIK